jgi:hypothetical protein
VFRHQSGFSSFEESEYVLSRIHCVLKCPHRRSLVKLKRHWTHGRFRNFGPPQKFVLAYGFQIL